MAKVIRVERFISPLGTTELPLAEAIEIYGKDELHEHLQGYHCEAAFFMTNNGKNVYPITMEDLEI
jgi:hypothetical protein